MKYCCKNCGEKLSGRNWFESFKNQQIYICRTCHKVYCRNWRIKNKVKMRRYTHDHREKIKIEVFKHYSPNICCQKCGERDMRILTLDHLKGDGARHRFRIKKWAGFETYQWAKKNNYPRIFQVLCFNCQLKKRRINNEIKTSDSYWSEYRKRLRRKVFQVYLPICRKCGNDDLDVLTLHHINGGGRKHLQSIGGSLSFYRWIVQSNYPKELKVLCMNCNFKEV